jgi:predicted aldo/keto reductase-like oxidoreductase
MEKKLGFGCMRLPLTDPKDQTSIDIPQFEKMVDLFLERGFRYFDTAYMYHDHESERAVRKALVERHPRDSFTITTKLPVGMLKTEEDLERIFHEQLEKTGAGFFDYYWLHNLNREDIDMANQLGCWEFIQKKKEEGLIRHIGFSYHDMPDLLDEILTQHPETEYVQLQINYLDWEADNVKARENYEVCVKHGKPVIVMEPVKGGTLAQVPTEVEEIFKEIHPNLSVPSWAVRYAASLPNVFMVLSGMSDLAQLEDNSSYMEDFKPLDEVEKQAVFKAADLILKAASIKCTACRYCVEGCPKKIPIPEYFQLYNEYQKAGGGWTAPQREAYRELSETEGVGKASDCIRCGKCEKACPQHLKIREYLLKVKEKLEE